MSDFNVAVYVGACSGAPSHSKVRVGQEGAGHLFGSCRPMGGATEGRVFVRASIEPIGWGDGWRRWA
jgi:hypothetical protein